MAATRAFRAICYVLPALIMGCISPIERVTCPDGTPVTIVKDISKAYPIYATAYDTRVGMSLAKLSKLEVGADVGNATEIVRLREELKGEQVYYENMMKTALLGLQASPCQVENQERFWDLLLEINSQAQSLSDFVGQPLRGIVTAEDRHELLGWFDRGYQFAGKHNR